MTDSELLTIKNHIAWGWHDDKGNNDVQQLFDEVMHLRTIAAKSREEGIEAMRKAVQRHMPMSSKIIDELAERLKGSRDD